MCQFLCLHLRSSSFDWHQSTDSYNNFMVFNSVDCVRFHNLYCAWLQCSVQTTALWVANKVKTFVSAEQNNSIWSPIIRYKELLSVILWYGKLCIINIWYCWTGVGFVPSNIPLKSFYTWQPCHTFCLNLAMLAVLSSYDVFRFSCCVFSR